jgi:hypothetical protein
MENDRAQEMINTDLDEGSGPDKATIECICPKCGERHILSLHWIGRGTPRKYCPLCRNSL